MKIGTVVNIEIKGADKTCIIVNKKCYSELTSDCSETLWLLIRFGGAGILPTEYPRSCLPITIMKDDVVCYELMYGDSRVWILGKSMLGDMVKAPQQ